MKFEDALHELRTEAVEDKHLHQAVDAVRKSKQVKRKSMLRRGLPFAIGITAVVGFSLFPWRKGDQLWAQAKQSLADAKVVHLSIESTKTRLASNVWIHGRDIREASDRYDFRYNGKLVTLRCGQVSIHSPANKNELYFTSGAFSYLYVIDTIQKGKSKPTPKTLNGKEYMTYRIPNGGGMIGSPSDPAGPKGMVTMQATLTAFVDPDIGKIVRIEQSASPSPEFVKYLKKIGGTLPPDEGDRFRMVATVDYPTNVDETIFNPPADSISRDESKKMVANMLKNKIGEATVQGQRIALHGLLYDGHTVHALWTGYGADFGSDDRFQIEGIKLTNRWDVRALSSAKKVHAQTADIPYCQQGSEAESELPKTVNLTLPVFAPDKTRPYPSGKGFHSKKVGTATFKDVPVTYGLWIQIYERQLGLQGIWW